MRVKSSGRTGYGVCGKNASSHSAGANERIVAGEPIAGEIAVGAAPPYLTLRGLDSSLSDKLEKQLFEILFTVPGAEFLERAHGQDPAAMHDRHAVAELFDLAHDVC